MNELIAMFIVGLIVGLILGYLLRAAIGRDEVANACRDRDVVIQRLEARVKAARNTATRWSTTVGREYDSMQDRCGKQILHDLSRDD